jgi:methylenetetrahydrofolate dehydrogenase (NADP+)/methenyltetrahydrofolate cyclohydrolase
MTIIDGRAVAKEQKQLIQREVSLWCAEGHRAPHLAILLIGNNGASESYVANKLKTCSEVGIQASLYRFEPTVSEEIILNKIKELNRDSGVDGIIVQSPFPSHIAPQMVNETISPSKDVDGFHPMNAGRLQQNKPCYIAATPKGIVQLLNFYRIETQGKHCVVIGRSNIVGLPMSILMSSNSQPGNCTVTICHSKTKNLKDFTRAADILIAAIGIPEFVTADMVKKGAVVIDVGISRVSDSGSKTGYLLKGDVKFDEVASQCSYITPVPGGVGPMTIIGLLQNTMLAAKKSIYH